MLETYPDQTFTNANEIRIVGMSRSGNHAVINWILAQLRGRYCYLNCVEPGTNPFHSARPLEDEQCYVSNYPVELDHEQQGWLSQKDHLLYNYEDCFLGMVAGRNFESQRGSWIGISRRRTDVLILRDPFNLFASRMKVTYSQVTPRTAVRIWKQHARASLGMQSYSTFDPVCIRYNRWVDDASYRRGLADALGLVFTDEGRHTVSRCGGGSSFDGVRFDGRADRMEVHHRWKQFIDDPAYRSLFDEEMLKLAGRIFPTVTREARRGLSPMTKPEMETAIGVRDGICA